MGCAAASSPSTSIPLTPKETAGIDSREVHLDEADQEDVRASFEIWRWSGLPKGLPGQPNRSSHEKHMQRLDHFLWGVDRNFPQQRGHMHHELSLCNPTVLFECMRFVLEIENV